jgi:hypothetical protein
MEQPAATPPAAEQDRAFEALVASVERLDELALADEQGRAIVEPASAFHWS